MRGSDADITRTVSLGARVPRVPILHGRKAVKAGRVCHRTPPSITRVVRKTVTRFQPGFWVCLTVQNARIKNRTRGRPSADGALASHQLSTPKSKTTKARHIERTTRASLARGNRLDGRISRRAPSRGRRRPPRVPRAPTPSTDERPPTARRVRAGRESPGARRPGARVLRGGAGRRGRPKRKLRDTRGHRRRLPRGCAPVERRLPATSPVIFPAKNAPPVKPPPKNRQPGRNLRLTPPPPRPFPQARTSARPRRAPRPRTPSASPSRTRRTSARRRSRGWPSPDRRSDRRRRRARALRR